MPLQDLLPHELPAQPPSKLASAILAPIVIGSLVGLALPLQQNFMAIAIPAVIAAVAVALINHKRSASAQHEDSLDALDAQTAVPEQSSLAGSS